jgi:hypothetical protein
VSQTRLRRRLLSHFVAEDGDATGLARCSVCAIGFGLTWVRVGLFLVYRVRKVAPRLLLILAGPFVFFGLLEGVLFLIVLAESDGLRQFHFLVGCPETQGSMRDG